MRCQGYVVCSVGDGLYLRSHGNRSAHKAVDVDATLCGGVPLLRGLLGQVCSQLRRDILRTHHSGQMPQEFMASLSGYSRLGRVVEGVPPSLQPFAHRDSDGTAPLAAAARRGGVPLRRVPEYFSVNRDKEQTAQQFRRMRASSCAPIIAGVVGGGRPHLHSR